MSSTKSSPIDRLKYGVKKTTEKFEADMNKSKERMEAFVYQSSLFQLSRKIGPKKNVGNESTDGVTAGKSLSKIAEHTRSDEKDEDAANNTEREDVGNGDNYTIDDKQSSYSTSAQLLIIIIISISTVYHTWYYSVDVVGNQIPFSVAIHWALVAYIIGGASSIGAKNDMATPIDDDVVDDSIDMFAATNDDESNGNHEEDLTKSTKLSKGRLLLPKMKQVYLNANQRRFKRNESNLFFTNLKPVGLKTKNPISQRMMDRLLKYSPDFRRRKSFAGEIDMKQMLESCLQVQDQLSNEIEGEAEEEVNYEIGAAPLGNLRASKLERDFDYVEPMCTFRGMDFFVGDFPEKDIWKQPLLLNNGLRDTPTMIGNFMLPNGNLVCYLQMPDLFDDWDNIPEETEDDPPDVKALKRFFTGDLEYQRERLKIVPVVVKAPYMVKVVAPSNSSEMVLHTPSHPVNVKKVNKAEDPLTGNQAAALMEVDVDFYTNAAFGRIINIVFPHLSSITIDVAFVIQAPCDAQGNAADEPSACLGIWRIDKVDFLSCAQLPEKPIEVVEQEIKDIMKSFAM